MTSSAPEAAASWPAPPPDSYPPGIDADEAGPYAADQHDPRLESEPEAWSDWEAYEDGADLGLAGPRLVVFSAVAAAACTALNLMLTSGSLTFFFDLCFVVVCLVSTMAVKRADMFTAGVLPPLLYAGVIAVLTIVAPEAFAAGSGGVSKVFLTGLADHAFGLVSGYAVALATVAARVAATSPARR